MARKKDRLLRPGDEVVVRPPDEILSTLDAEGTLDGLPFMPEMVDHTGKRFRVLRRVEKTCVEDYQYQRRFPGNDVVLLDEQRCNGEGHDGCKRGCMLFWKEAWLRPVKPGEPAPTVRASQKQALRERLKVKTDPTHYFCQSTRLGAATEPFPGKQIPWMLWVALREIRFGSRSVPEVIRMGLRYIKLKTRTAIYGSPRLMRGPLKRTPTATLNLAPGDWVQIKSRDEILQTLDSKQKNRGLRIAYAMTEACGNRFEVGHRVDRIISETTGEMRDVRNTVALRGLKCLCYYQCLGCPRGDLSYWREIWLDRVEEARFRESA